MTFDDSVSPGWLDAPGGFDIMITSDGCFERGNPNGAPTAGESQTVVLTLGDTGLTPEELAASFHDFHEGLADRYATARFQAVGPDGGDSDKVGGRIPEPAAVLLLGLGGMAVLGRRRRPLRDPSPLN